MIEECERRLNRRIGRLIPPDVIATTTNNRHKNAGTLTLGAYVHVLKEEKHFNLLDWPWTTPVRPAVHDVADIRNKMMHFSPDPSRPTNGEQSTDCSPCCTPSITAIEDAADSQRAPGGRIHI